MGRRIVRIVKQKTTFLQLQAVGAGARAGGRARGREKDYLLPFCVSKHGEGCSGRAPLTDGSDPQVHGGTLGSGRLSRNGFD